MLNITTKGHRLLQRGARNLCRSTRETYSFLRRSLAGDGEGNAITRVRVPAPMQIFATCLQKKGRADACRVGNSWQIISDVILPNLLLRLALFYKWKWPSG